MTTMQITIRTVRAAVLAVAISAPFALGSGGAAFAQDRPFWEDNDSTNTPRRSTRPRRDDAFRPPEASNDGPSGGFGRQADVNGQPWDARSAPGGYAPPQAAPYGQAPGPAPSYGAPPYSSTPTQGYGNDPRYASPPSPPPNYGNQGAAGYDGTGGGSPTYGTQGYNSPGANSPPYSDRGSPRQSDPYGNPSYGSGSAGRANDAYRPPQPGGWADNNRNEAYRPEYRPDNADAGGYGQPYSAPRDDRYGGPANTGYDQGYNGPQGTAPRQYSENEVVDTGHRFFGSVSQGIARAIESVFRRQGRPNGYILGEDAGGAFVAGLRYGEGVLTTKDAGTHRVYWQGPSLGYDFGGEGSKAMVLVYNLRDPSDIYHRFGGVQGAAYLVGGVSVQFQTHEHVTLAVIRSGVGLRLGANVGYLKYSRRPTWNPF